MMGGGAVAAAAARRKKKQEEEEEMTEYTSDDLDKGFEFKIVRSALGAFKKPQTLRQVVEEEARAGWTLLEKFDNDRLRFKRPISARAADASLPEGIDPYRTTYGMSEGLMVFLIVGSLVLLFAGFALLMSTLGL
jgi:hypothetical protein